MKKKKRKLDAGKLVREMARERIGQPKSGQVLPDKRKQELEKIKEREALEGE